MSTERYVILTDIHFPYEAPCYELMLKVIADPDLNITRLYLNGDIAEFLAVSSHPKAATDSKLLKEEIDYCNMRLNQLGDLGYPVTYLCGNHEYRLERFLHRQAPELWGLGVDVPSLLDFANRPRFRWVSYGIHQFEKVGKTKLWLRHHPLRDGKQHCMNTLLETTVDIAYGHTHQAQSASMRKKSPGSVGVLMQAHSIPFLGDMDAHIFNYRGQCDNWANGFAFVHPHPKNDSYRLENIILENPRELYYNGKTYKV